MNKHKFGLLAGGICAGAVNGLLGAGGGMLLVPILGRFTDLKEEEVFPASVAVMLPLCVVSLCVTAFSGGICWQEALPYLPGSAIGGLLAGLTGKRVSVKWLHRGLGLLILWGGIRYLW